MVSIRYVSHALKSSDFQICVHLGFEKKRGVLDRSRYELWVVLQTFDGRSNEVVRCHGRDFRAVATEVSSQMRLRLRKKPPRFSLLSNPFKLLPLFERTA